MFKGQAFIALVAAAALAPLGASALTIDEFDTAQGPLAVNPGGTTEDASSAQTLGTDIIGGERDMRLTVPAGPAGVFDSTATVTAGVFNLANDATASATIHFQWDGSADTDKTTLDPTGLGGIDLTDGASLDAFEVQFLFDDLPTLLTFTVWTDAGNSSTVTWPNPGLLLTPSLTLYVPFSAFSGSADFTNVGAIEMSLESPFNAADVRIDYVRTALAPVPLPPAVLLFASGLFFMGLLRRR